MRSDPIHSSFGEHEFHACCLYESDSERRDTLTRFVLEGVRLGEKVMCALANGDGELLQEELARSGEEPGALIAEGRLVLIESGSAYLGGERSDPDSGLDRISALLDEGRREGYPRGRTVHDLQWLSRIPGAHEALFRYESAVDRLLQRHRASGMCMYRRSDLSVGDQLCCLGLHPVAVVGDETLRNPDFRTPTEARDEDPIQVSLSWRRAASERFEAAARNQRLLDQILTSVEAAVLVVDGEGRTVSECNRAAESMFGYPREELVGMATRSLHVDEAHWRQFGELSHQVLDEGAVYRADFRMRRADGSSFPTRHVVAILDPDEGGTGRVVSTVRDLTVEVEAKRRETESAERFRAIAESITDAVLTVDTDSRILYANPAANQMMGVSDGPLAGRSMTDLMPHALREAHRKGMARYLETGERRMDWSRVEMPVRRMDGTTFDAEISFGEYRVEGKPYLTGVIRDATERRRLEAELRQSQKMEAVGRLASGVAHDFNNLLTLIRGHSEMIHDDLPDGSSLREDVRGVLGAVDRAAGLTNQLLAFSRSQVLSERVLDLADLVEGVRPLLERASPSRIRLSIERAEGPHRVRGDENELHRVVLNLVLNAGDAIADAGKIRLSVRTVMVSKEEIDGWKGGGDFPGGRYVRLRVADTGSGIEPDTMDRIFDPFFTTKSEGRGTGLGLSSVLGIVRQMGGHISVRSEPGEGTTFDLHFPEAELDDPVAGGSAGPPDEPAEASGTGAGGTDGDSDTAGPPQPDETVLVVEDDRALAAVLSRALGRRGYRVLLARDGDEALEIAEESGESIDIALSDVVIPGVRGTELLQRLRRKHPNLRLVLMSGHTPSEIFGQIPPEADGFLAKPFSPLELTDTIRRVLDG